MADFTPTSGSFGPAGTFGQQATVYQQAPMGSSSLSTNTPVITSHAGLPSNTTIVHTYLATPWKGGLDRWIIEGNPMIVLVSKQNANMQKKRFDFNSFLNLGQFNRILSQFYTKGMDEFEKVKVMSNNNEDELLHEITNAPEDKWNDKQFDDTWRKLRLDPKSEYMKGLTKQGIREKFNVLGSLVNDSTGAYNESLSGSRKRMKYKTLNVGLKGVAYVRNYWGSDAVPTTTLWLILKRRYNTITAEYEEFALIPYVTEKGDIPSISDRTYQDLNGNLQYGDCFYFGDVLDAGRHRNPNTETVKKAAGLLGTMDDQIESDKALRMIKVNLRGPVKGSRWI